MTRRILPVMVLLLLLAGGCRSSRDASRAAQAAAEVQDTEAMPHYYTANFSGTAEGYTASGQLRIQSDSIIWVSASKVIELARVRLTPDSVLLHVKVTNSSFQGTYEDVYRRFRYRTSFDELYRMVMSDDAADQLAAILGQFGVDATIRLDPLKEVDRLSFPMAIPARSHPL